MKIISTYPAKIKESSGAFEATAVLYRQAVDYFIGIMLKHWDKLFASLPNINVVTRQAELLCWPTSKVPIREQTVVSVDLGINNACVCSVMTSEGTILARHFLRLDREKDSLNRALQRIKNAQKQGNRKMPRLWAKAKGINDSIAVKTATFIMDLAVYYSAHVIVMEKLDLKGSKHGSKKQRLHHWRAQYVQQMVEDKAHRNGQRVSRVCAWNTSKLAFDGSGTVTRDEKNHSLCTFQNGKRYHCDLSASYNIGARYFVREIFKSLSVTTGQRIAAKVPECVKRSTCTLSSLLRLHAELGSTERQSSECGPHRTEAVPPITNEGSLRL